MPESGKRQQPVAQRRSQPCLIKRRGQRQYNRHHRWLFQVSISPKSGRDSSSIPRRAAVRQCRVRSRSMAPPYSYPLGCTILLQPRSISPTPPRRMADDRPLAVPAVSAAGIWRRLLRRLLIVNGWLSGLLAGGVIAYPRGLPLEQRRHWLLNISPRNRLDPTLVYLPFTRTVAPPFERLGPTYKVRPDYGGARGSVAACCD